MKKILIVDGTPDGLTALRLALPQEGITVFEANSGRLAMDIHRREKADLIILPLFMPALDGEETTRRIRTDPALRDVSIVMVADNARQATRTRCLAAGANDFLSRPFQPEDLQAAVGQLLAVAARKNTKLLAQIEVRDGENAIPPFIGRILNLSATGLLLETDAPLHVGLDLALTFVVPGRQAQTRATALVVRRTADQDAVRWGLHFTTLDEPGRLALMDWVGKRSTF